MTDRPGVKRHVGTDADATLAFISEAHAAGYKLVVLAPDVADALHVRFGAPFSSAITAIRSEHVPVGLAVALPDDMEFRP